MKLKITGLKETFDILNFNIDPNCLTIESDHLLTFIDTLGENDEPPAPPAAPKKVIYIETNKMGAYTRAQYEAMGWSEAQMVDAGFLEAVATVETAHVAEAPPEAPPAPKAPVEKAEETAPPPQPEEPKVCTIKKVKYTMAAKADGATRQQFLDTGWTDEDLISEGYLIPVPVPEAAEWPQKNENEEWVDSSGTTFDKVKHGMTKEKIPSVMKDGLFKTKRGYVATDAPAPTAAEETAPVPPKPAVPPKPTNKAPAAPAAPKAPAAPAAPTANAAPDEDLDEELSSLIKDWV